jgi:glycosyltransferase involved in cell wall biosynthesis
MKIGVDIRVLMDKNYSGISEYTANLLSEIKKQNDAKDNGEAGNEYKLFYNSYHNLEDRLGKWRSGNFSLISTRWPNKIFNYFLEKILAYPKLDKVLNGVDLFWSPHFNFSSFSNSKSLKKIITVHDLSFLRYPEFFSSRKNFWHKALNVKKILKESDRIIAVSNNTKNDLVEVLNISPDKVKVIYSGNNLSKREISSTEKEELLNRFELSGRLILYLGNIEPRKNIKGLIESYNNLRAENPEFKDLKLVLAGAKAWKNKEIFKSYNNSKFKDDIYFLGYISKSDKEVLYSISSVFVYPSYYEGFGFPVLEAMAYGLPVICSNISSLPEIVADAAITINPYNNSEIETALKLILSDENLRSSYISKGYEREKLFSWSKTASEYIEEFKKICQ